jgi:hypothetical protein
LTIALLLGLGMGACFTVAFYALDPGPAPLGAALAELHRPRPATEDEPTGASPVLARISRSMGLGRYVTPRIRADLAVTGHDETWYLTWCILVGLVGVATGPVIDLVALLAGASLPWVIPLCFSLLAGPGAVLAQVLSVRNEAARRRADFSFALSAYLDLVVVSMAAGRGTEGALSVAAEAGSGYAFDSLRQALASARLRGIAPWDAFDELGSSLGVEELCGIAASVRLAGSSGAKVRTSLAARAKTVRERGLAEAHAASESATERMSVPVVLLVLGFIVLIGWPAVIQITTQL